MVLFSFQDLGTKLLAVWRRRAAELMPILHQGLGAKELRLVYIPFRYRLPVGEHDFETGCKIGAFIILMCLS